MTCSPCKSLERPPDRPRPTAVLSQQLHHVHFVRPNMGTFLAGSSSSSSKKVLFGPGVHI